MHFRSGAEGGDADLEADLVVALAGAAVGDRGGAVLAGGGDQVLDDHRAGERGDQRVAVHVQGVRLERGQAVLVGELVAGVGDVGLDRAAVEGALADGVQVLAALADVDGDGDDLGAGRLGDPADGDGGVQAAGVGENNALGHEISSVCRVCVVSVVGLWVGACRVRSVARLSPSRRPAREAAGRRPPRPPGRAR